MQVLSESVSKALLDMGEEYSETAKFTEMMDKLFDCLNVNNFTAGKTKRKPFQDPYRQSDDFRIKVLHRMHNYNGFQIGYTFKICFVHVSSGLKRHFCHTWINGKRAYQKGQASIKKLKY